MRTLMTFAPRIGGALLFLVVGTLTAAGQTPTLAVKPKLPTLGPDLTIARLEYVGCDRLAVTVRNAGSVAVTQPFTVELRILFSGGEGQSLRTAVVSNGVTGLGTTTVVFDQAFDVESGQVGYIVTADPANAVAETKEDNNSADAGANSGLTNCPTLSIGYDISPEGKPVEFLISISRPFAAPVSVGYQTQNGTASGASACGTGADFAHASGKLTFAAGTTTLTQKVPVMACADRVNEGSETFVLKLASPVNARMPVPSAVGTITNVQP
jgi:hypothetical protein